ncbi:MAG: glycosyltransferase family 4 protein [Candidatus Baldrarchaeia archaeon]
MRILFLAACYDINGFFGDTIRIRELIRNLSRNNEIVALVQAQGSPYSVKLNNAKVITIKVHHSHRQLSSLIVSPYYLFKIFKRYRPQIIYETLGGIAGSSIFAKFLNIPIISELHGPIELEERLMGLNSIYTNLIHPTLIKMSLTLSDHVVVVHEGYKKVMHYLYNIKYEDISVIPNGANTEVFKPINVEEARSVIGLKKDHYYIGFVGNLAPWQGLEYLIEAAPFVLKRFPNSTFLIVGDGIMKEKLVKKARKIGVIDNFIFEGKVEYEKVPIYINCCDVCVAPFKLGKKYLSPIKIYEYLSCEKPVVASRIKGVDFIERIKAGKCVSPGDVEGLGLAIVEILEMGDEKILMGKRGRAEVVKHYSWKFAARKIEELCKRQLDKYGVTL